MKDKPDELERLTVAIPIDAKRLLARIAFEESVPMSDYVRELIDTWLLDAPLPTGVKLSRRLESLRTARGKRP